MSIDEAQRRFGRDARFNAALAAGLAGAGLLLFLVVRSLFGSSPFPDGSDGEWRSTQVVIDGEVVELEIDLMVDDREGSYQGACNSFDYDGAEWRQTQKGCSNDTGSLAPMEIDGRLLDAVRSGGELIDAGDRLRFEHDGVTIVLARSGP